MDDPFSGVFGRCEEMVLGVYVYDDVAKTTFAILRAEYGISAHILARKINTLEIIGKV